MRGNETIQQSAARCLQVSLKDDSGLTGWCCGSFGREPCWNLAEQGYSHRTFPYPHELGARFLHPDSDRRLTISRSPWCSKTITRIWKVRSGGNKVHGVHARQCRNLGGFHQVVHS